MKTTIATLFCTLGMSLPLAASAQDMATDKKSAAPQAAGVTEAPSTPTSIDFSDPGTGEPEEATKKAAAAKDLRFTLGHEASYRPTGNTGVVNNRSWFRLEYSKFFLDSFYAQLDTKLNGFWGTDHRAKAENKKALLESNTQEAFLQYSGKGGQTSFKMGVQRLIWGESEAGVITDEVSPRNFSELFFVPLEESRIGQFMLNLDQFTSSGDWSLFFVPNPKFNKYPKNGTAYFLDPFNGKVDYRDEPASNNQHEYGMRWKKTFGKSDISFMAASLIDNDYVLRLDSVTPAGRMQVARLKQRFSLAGVTFNYAKDHFLLKGEIGLKSSKGFNDSTLNVIKKDVIDSSLGLTYALGQSNTIGLELVNSHVRNWDSRIVGVPQNSNSLVLNTTLFFLNDTLTVNWLTIYTQPYASYQSSLRTSYKWNDNTTFSIDAHLIAVPDKNSRLYSYRQQDQIVFRVQHQF